MHLVTFYFPDAIHQIRFFRHQTAMFIMHNISYVMTRERILPEYAYLL